MPHNERSVKPLSAERLAHAQLERASDADITELSRMVSEQPPPMHLGRLAELEHLWRLWQGIDRGARDD